MSCGDAYMPGVGARVTSASPGARPAYDVTQGLSREELGLVKISCYFYSLDSGMISFPLG